AEVLRRLGDPDGARARLREALVAAPDHGRAWRLRGAVDRERGASAEAIEALERAGELNALEPAGFAELGALYLERNEAQPAASLYRRVAARLDGDEARAALERAAALAPDAATLVALGDRARGPQAARWYQQALELDPSSREAALALVREAVPSEAARVLEAVRERAPDAAARARLSSALATLLRDRLDD